MAIINSTNQTTVANLAFVDTKAVGDYSRQLSVAKNAYLRSGILSENQAITNVMGGDHPTFRVPNWSELDEGVPTTGDDSTNRITAQALKGALQTGIKCLWTKSHIWSTVAAYQAGSDPESFYAAQTAEYWNKMINFGTLQTLNAFRDSEEAGNFPAGESSMSVALGTTLTATDPANAAQQLNEVTLPIALTTALGEQAANVRGLITHPDIWGRLSGAAVTSFRRQDEQSLLLDDWFRYTLAADKNAPKDAGTVAGTSIYTTYAIVPGAMNFGDVAWPAGALDLTVDPELGNGAGAVKGISRRLYNFHLAGMSWTNAGGLFGSANSADANFIGAVGNWTRVWKNEHMGVVAIRHAA